MEDLVSQLHIFPTILQEAGLHSSYADYEPLDRYAAGGAVIAGPGYAMGEITWEPNEPRGASMKISLREGSLKYIVTLAGERGDERFVSEVVNEELYDLSRDPHEKTNLLPDVALDIGGMRRATRDLIDKARFLQADRRGQEVVLDDALREQLKALGYVN